MSVTEHFNAVLFIWDFKSLSKHCVKQTVKLINKEKRE